MPLIIFSKNESGINSIDISYIYKLKERFLMFYIKSFYEERNGGKVSFRDCTVSCCHNCIVLVSSMQLVT